MLDVQKTSLEGVKVITFNSFCDSRGSTSEAYNRALLQQQDIPPSQSVLVGASGHGPRSSLSKSSKAQDKLIRVKVASNLVRKDDVVLRVLFHLTGSGDATWAEFAAAIFSDSRAMARPCAAVTPILTADYLTAARRPANSSRLDNEKIHLLHGVRLPLWRESMRCCVDELVSSEFGKTD